MISRRLFATLTSGLTALMLASQPVEAASDFIRTYIEAKGGCGSSASALSFVLTGQDRQSPFGKPAADWSDEDLDALKTSMAECEVAAASRGNPYHLTDVRNLAADLINKIPPIVRAARAEQETRVRQIEARRKIARSRIDEANRRKAEAKTSAETEVARLESEAARAEGEARQAITEANRQIDQAAHTTGDKKAALDDELARLREKSLKTKGLSVKRLDPAVPQTADLSRRGVPPDQLRELPTEVTRATTSTNFVACKTADQLVTAARDILTSKRDTLERLVTGGACFVIDRGTEVRVATEDTKNSSKAACVGIDGHPDCLWLPSNILRLAE